MTEEKNNRIDDLAKVLKGGFASIDKRFDKTADNIENLARMTNEGFKNVDVRLDRMETKLDNLDHKVDVLIDQTITDMKRRLTAVEDKVSQLH